MTEFSIGRITAPILLLAPVLAVLLPSCGGGGGGGTTGSSFSLLGVRTETGESLPVGEVHLNERLVFTFSAPIDPDSLAPDSLRIRRRRIVAGRPVGQAFTVAASGSLLIEDNQLSFVPSLPIERDFSDAGFLADTLYQIELDAFPAFDTIRSTDGAPLNAPFVTTFRTREASPLFLDPSPGPPRVLAVVVDLNQDGVAEGDGDPSTQEPEEFFEVDATPFAEAVPLGLARKPQVLGLVLSEPLLPETVFLDEDEDGLPDPVFLFDEDRRSRIPTDLTLLQEFVPERDRFETRILLRPRTALPPQHLLSLRLEPGPRDFSSPGAAVDPILAGFTTQNEPGVFEDTLVQTFETRRDLDPSSTAEWDLGDSNALVAGLGIGGSGVDGALILPRDSIAQLDTNTNRGFFNFTEINLEVGSVLEVDGPNPLSLRCLGNVTISGRIDLSGEDGQHGFVPMGDEFSLGGAARVGGTPGAPSGSVGFTPGAGPRGVGGGEAGASGPTAGGGGGGGHARVGGSLRAIQNLFAGRGGSAYGTTTIDNLFAGSGGGGGGDLIKDAAQTGGAGGGGGGAISFDIGGTFTLGEGGAIHVNGGRGGDGGPGSPFGGGGGGGGSGGSIRIRSSLVDSLIHPESTLSAQGGAGGRAGGGTIGPGGGGSSGRIYIESLDTNGDGQANDYTIDTSLVTISPPAVRGLLLDELGRSFALSRFLDTGFATTRFAFDGSDPVSGEIRVDTNSLQDVVFRGNVSDDATISISFQGAKENPDLPRVPDPDSFTDFVTDIRELNGFQFLRYRVEFDLGDGNADNERPVLEELRIQFEFEIR